MGDKKDVVEGTTDYSKLSLREALAVQLAEQMCDDPHAISDEFFDQLREEFSEREIAMMSLAVSMFIGVNHLNETLDLEPEACEVSFS